MVIKVACAGPRGPGINPGALQISMVAKMVSSDDDSDIDDIVEAIESIVDVTNTVYASDIINLGDYDSCDEAQLCEPSNGSDTLIQRDDAYNDCIFELCDAIPILCSIIHLMRSSSCFSSLVMLGCRYSERLLSLSC